LLKIELQQKLAKTPLGKVLSEELNVKDFVVEASASLYTKLEKQVINEKPSIREFWLGAKRLLQTIDIKASSSVSAIVIKKQGDFPAFWHKDNSFIETIEELYKRVKTKQNLI
jgi:uncharacterized Zn finger protein